MWGTRNVQAAAPVKATKEPTTNKLRSSGLSAPKADDQKQTASPDSPSRSARFSVRLVELSMLFPTGSAYPAGQPAPVHEV